MLEPRGYRSIAKSSSRRRLRGLDHKISNGKAENATRPY